MSEQDKARGKGEELRGRTKEGVGKTTGDDALQRQGRNEQRKGSLRQAAEKFKDAFKR